MQRVMSFRGYGGETSEFVTKRLCFSFLLSVGFLCLLGGFLLGGFATEWNNIMRDKRRLHELADNGLHGARSLRALMLDRLNASAYHENFETDSNVQRLRQQGVTRIGDIFADLSIFRLNVNETKTSTVATVCGSEEQDRYIVLSASGEGFDVAIKVARTLDYVHRNKGWEPKRSLIFCVFLGSTDFCSKKFLERVKPKIVAYIAIHGNAARGGDEIVVSGSGMVQATIVDAFNALKYYNANYTRIQSTSSLPRLNIDIPHAVLSFVQNESNAANIELNQKFLAQVIGLTMLNLSEETFFRWDPKYFGKILDNALSTIKNSDLQEIKGNLNKTITNLVDSIRNFNSELGKVDVLKTLDVRIINDRLVDLDRALLCPDTSLRSKTDLTKFKIFPHEPTHIVKMNLNEIQECYKAATDIIVEQAFCRRIFKDVEVF